MLLTLHEDDDVDTDAKLLFVLELEARLVVNSCSREGIFDTRTDGEERALDGAHVTRPVSVSIGRFLPLVAVDVRSTLSFIEACRGVEAE